MFGVLIVAEVANASPISLGKYALTNVTAFGLIGVLLASPAGAFTVLFSFAGGTDGAYPSSRLVRDSAGDIYGTTDEGGNDSCNPPRGCGTVFALAGGGESVLHAFSGGTGDGSFPGALIKDRRGNLYGTTEAGGGDGCNNGYGCGIVYKLAADGTESVLYRFAGGTDGAFPHSLVRDKAGNLYGTTVWGGGTGCGGTGCGTVFKLASDGNETVLYAFTGGSDGAEPGNLIQDEAGNLYGTTAEGGTACGCGTVFKLAPKGTETVLYAFTGGSDGAQPDDLIPGDTGNFFGTTGEGGNDSCNAPRGCGTVFELMSNGVESVLHAFAGSDGKYPNGVVMDTVGNLYGSTFEGGGRGGNGNGIVFKLLPDGTERGLHRSTERDGINPDDDLNQDKEGRLLYGTTELGGTHGYGVVFELKESR